MPSDAALLEGEHDVADRYDILIEEIGQHCTDERPSLAEEAQVVQILADAFGLGGGMGVYWGTLHLSERYTPSIAYPVIRDRVLHGLPQEPVLVLFHPRATPSGAAAMATTCRSS
jgi:hypothetical protein